MSNVIRVLGAPYRGLRPYTQAEADLFFGRDNDRAIITSNLFASRLTLLFGPSGVGKSSVLRAGVAYDLQQQGHAVVTFAEWHTDPLPALRNAIAEEVNRVSESEIAPDTGDSLRAFLAACSDQLDNPLIIILDQFEEFLLYHPGPSDERSFISEFARAINARELRVSFLIAIREDFVAELDRFKSRIPQLFSNYLRLDRLDSQSARDAIEKPLEKIGWTWEPAVVSTVIEQVQPGRLGLDQGGGEVHLTTEQAGPQRVETPFLQIVMLRLWEEEKAQGSTEIHTATLERLGGPAAIVRQYLDAFMDNLSHGQQKVSAQIFYHLVTPSGTKIAQSAHDLAYFTNIPEEHITEVLLALSGPARLLRTVSAVGEGGSRYEIFHDALARPMLDWRRRFLERQQREEEQATRLALRRRWLQRAAIAFGALVLILIVGGIVWSQISATLQLGRKQIAQDDSNRPLVVQQGFLTSNTELFNGFPFFFGRQLVETDWDQKDLWEEQKKRVTNGEYYLPRDPFGSASWVGQVALDNPIEKAQALWLAGDTSASAEVLSQALPKEGSPYTRIIISLIRFLDEYPPAAATKESYRQAFAKYLQLDPDTLDADDKERRDQALRVLSQVGAPNEDTLKIVFGLLDKAAQSGRTDEVEYLLSFLGSMSGDDPQLGTLVFNRLTNFLKAHEQSDVETAVIKALNGITVTEPVSLTTYLLTEFKSGNQDAKDAAVDALSNIQYPTNYQGITTELQTLARDLLDRAYAESCPSSSLAGRVLLRLAVRPETQYSDPVWSMLLPDFKRRHSQDLVPLTERTGNLSEAESECDIYSVLLQDRNYSLRANLPYDTSSLGQRVDFLLAVRDHPVLSSTVYTELTGWMNDRRKSMLAVLTPDRVAELTRAASITDTALVCNGCGFFSFVTDAVRKGAWDRTSALALTSKHITATGELNWEAAQQWLNLQTTSSPEMPAYNDEMTRIARGVLTDTHYDIRLKMVAAQVLAVNHALVSSTLETFISSTQNIPTLTYDTANVLWSSVEDPLLSDTDRAKTLAVLIQLNQNEAGFAARLADLDRLDEVTARQLAKPLIDAYRNNLTTAYNDYPARLSNAIQRLLVQQPALAGSMWRALEPDLEDLLTSYQVDNLKRIESNYGSSAGLRGLLAALTNADATLRAPIARKLAQLLQGSIDSEVESYVLAMLAGLNQTTAAWSSDFSDWATGVLADARETRSDWWIWYLIARDKPTPSRRLAEAMIASLSDSFQPGDSLAALPPMVKAYPDLIPQAGEALLTPTLTSEVRPTPQVIAALDELAQIDATVMQHLITVNLTDTQTLLQSVPLAQILLLPDLATHNPQLFTGYRADLLRILTSRGTANASSVAALTLARLRDLDDATRNQWFAAVKTLQPPSREVEARLVAEALRLANDDQTSQAAREIADRFWQQVAQDDGQLDLVESIGTTVSGTVSAENLYTHWLFSHFTPTLDSAYLLLPAYRFDTITDTAFLQNAAQSVLADWCSQPEWRQPLALEAVTAIVANQRITQADRGELVKSIISSLKSPTATPDAPKVCLNLSSATLYDLWYLYRQWKANLPELAEPLAQDIAQFEAEMLKTDIWSKIYQDNGRKFSGGAIASGNRSQVAPAEIDQAIALANLGMTSKTNEIRTQAADLLSRAARAQPVISRDVLTALAEPIISHDPDEELVKQALEQLTAVDNLSSTSVTDDLLIGLAERLAVQLPDPYDTSRGAPFTLDIPEKALNVLTQWAPRDKDLSSRIEAALRERIAISNTAYADIYPSLALARLRLRAQPEPIEQVLADPSEMLRLLIANGAVPSNIDPRKFDPILNGLLDSPKPEVKILAASGLVQQGQLSDANIQKVVATLDTALEHPVIERNLLERFTAVPITDTLERAGLWWLERADTPDFGPVLKMLGDPMRRASRQAAYGALLRWAANTIPDKIIKRVELLQSPLQELSHSQEPQTRLTTNRTLEALYLLQRAAQVKLHSLDAAKFEALRSTAPDWDERMTLPAQLAGMIVQQRETADLSLLHQPIRPDPTEPNDERSLAREIRSDERLTAALDPQGDVDLYRFEVNTDSSFSVDLNGFSDDKFSIPLLWCVLNTDGIQVYCQSSLAYGPAQPLNAGTYYLSVRDYPGDEVQAPYGYTVKITAYAVNPQPTSTPSFATVPPLNTPLPTSLPGISGRGVAEIEFNNDATQASSIRVNRPVEAAIDPAGEADWFEFTVPSDQQVTISVVYNSSGQFQPYVALLDKNTSYIDTASGYSGAAVISNRTLLPGQYYIRVVDNSYGGGPDYTYRLSLTAAKVSATPSAPPTPTPTPATSCFSGQFDPADMQKLTAGQVINSELSPTKACDMYTFAGRAGQVAAVTVAFTQTDVVDSFICIIPGGPGASINALLSCSGGSATSRRQQIETVLPNTGQYILFVTRFSTLGGTSGPLTPNASNLYSLELELTGPNAAPTAPPTPTVPP